MQRKKLEAVLLALGLEKEEKKGSGKEDVDMFNFNFDRKSKKASEIVKTMIADNGGRIKVSSVNGKVYEIRAEHLIQNALDVNNCREHSTMRSLT